MKNREVLTFDEHEVKEQFKEAASELLG
jgi:hypothetical protein